MNILPVGYSYQHEAICPKNNQHKASQNNNQIAFGMRKVNSKPFVNKYFWTFICSVAIMALFDVVMFLKSINNRPTSSMSQENTRTLLEESRRTGDDSLMVCAGILTFFLGIGGMLVALEGQFFQDLYEDESSTQEDKDFKHVESTKQPEPVGDKETFPPKIKDFRQEPFSRKKYYENELDCPYPLEKVISGLSDSDCSKMPDFINVGDKHYTKVEKFNKIIYLEEGKTIPQCIREGIDSYDDIDAFKFGSYEYEKADDCPYPLEEVINCNDELEAYMMPSVIRIYGVSNYIKMRDGNKVAYIQWINSREEGYANGHSGLPKSLNET